VHRIPQVALISSTAVLFWIGMMGVHELGHVLGAWCTGGSVVRVVLHPLTISRTDLSLNPSPLFVAWSGPIVGVFLPLCAWVIGNTARFQYSYLLHAFAGFCLIANGSYIAAGSFGRIGDCGDLLRHGAATWQLWLFGGVAIAVGLLLWNGLGSYFGLGASGNVDRVAAWTCAVAAVCLVVICLLLN
jgi:hypothetical protein